MAINEKSRSVYSAPSPSHLAYYPCQIDGKQFKTIFEAWQYLMEVNGRICIYHLERFLRQGKKMIYCHHISASGGGKNGTGTTAR
jgi:hypothetical protein